jgi:hypothetical protein
MGIFRAAFVSFNDLRSNLLPVKDNRCNKAKSRFSVDRNFLIPPRRPKKSTFASRLLSRSTHRRIAGRALIEPCYGPTSLPSGTTFEPGVASRDASFSSAVCREKSSSLTTSSRSSISLIVIGRVFFPIMANFNLCDECSAVPWRTYHCSLLFYRFSRVHVPRLYSAHWGCALPVRGEHSGIVEPHATPRSAAYGLCSRRSQSFALENLQITERGEHGLTFRFSCFRELCGM